MLRRAALLCCPPSSATTAVVRSASIVGVGQRAQRASSCAAAAGADGASTIPPTTTSSSTSPLDHPPPSLAAALPQLKLHLAGFDPAVPIEAAHTPPSAWFTDPAIHHLEMASVFRSSPLAVGSALQILAPGDYFTGSIGRQHPFAVLRDEDGRVRAFYNVCRHKGMRAVMGECGSLGPNGKIACPYHGWEYRLDGRLAKATRIKGIKDFVAREYGLVEIPVSLWGGHLVFLHLDRVGQENAQEQGKQEAASSSLAHLSPLLGKLEAEHGAFGEGMRHVARRVYRLNCNWKVVSDNYLDNAYHVPYAHKALGANLDLESYSATIHDGFSIQSCTGAPGSDARVGKAALYAYVWPNLMINRYGPWMDVNVVNPVSPRKCEVVFDYFLEERCIQEKIEHGKRDHAALEEFIAQSLQASDVVQQEDTLLCENVQIGLESAGYDRGRYAPRVEYPDHDFHCRLARELRAAVDRLERAVAKSP